MCCVNVPSGLNGFRNHPIITKMNLGLVLLAVVIWVGPSIANDSGESDRAAQVVWAIAGGNAMLPCDVSVSKENDVISTVLWFKGSLSMPIYSLDYRNGPLVHLATSDDLGRRTHFVLEESKPEEAHLAIKGIVRADEGVFRCRVDYLDSPSKNYKVNLSLVVPPNEPKIFDAQGREITGVAGPFREEYDLFLSCQVTGGRPKPKVSWWHNSTLLDSITDTTSAPGTVVSQLFIRTVSRNLLGAKLQCRAHVSKLLPAIVKEIYLQVFLKPVSVRIMTPNNLLSAGKPQALECEALGSNPPAKISWLLDGEVIKSTPITVTNVGNVSSSLATLILSPFDDGKDLTCRASNPRFPGGMIEDTRTIRVAFPPRVTVSVGSSENPATLKEGSDVQLICNTEARPAVSQYLWYRENEELHNNPAEGLVVLGRTMRLRNLTREDSGNYSCKATNSEGQAKSQTLTITILYVPVCKSGHRPREVATLRHTPLTLKCEVDSPLDAGPIRFSWTYNKTRDVLPISSSKTTNLGTTSELAYTPNMSGDFGTLACWATNSVGNQKVPCLFEVIPAKIPDPPRECNLVNESRSLEVICRAGADGGIPQHFLLEVLDGVHNHLPTIPLANTDENEISTMNDQGALSAPLPIPVHRETGDAPRFVLRGLRPGRKYGLLVYAVNAKGRSSPALLHDVTVAESLAEQFYTPIENNIVNDDFNITSSQSMAMILGGLLAAASLIILAIISASIVVICKRNNNRNTGLFGCGSNKRESASGPSMYSAPDDENGFAHFGTPNVMIRPCADIRRDGRRASRALSTLISSQEDPLVPIVTTIQEDLQEMPMMDVPSRRSQDVGPYTYVPYMDRMIYADPIQYRSTDQVLNQRIHVPQSMESIPRGVSVETLRNLERGSQNSMLRHPNYGNSGNMDAMIHRLNRDSDQILRFPENKISRVEISNSGDVGTVVRFELSKPELTVTSPTPDTEV